MQDQKKFTAKPSPMAVNPYKGAFLSINPPRCKACDLEPFLDENRTLNHSQLHNVHEFTAVNSLPGRKLIKSLHYDGLYHHCVEKWSFKFPYPSNTLLCMFDHEFIAVNSLGRKPMAVNS